MGSGRERSPSWSVIVPTGGTRLPIVRSSNVGASPFLGQLSGKQGGSTLLGPYTALGSLSINMSDTGRGQHPGLNEPARCRLLALSAGSRFDG